MRFCFRFTLICLMMLNISRINAQIHPLVSCMISGSSSVVFGSTETYTVTGGCTATSWTVNHGTIQSWNSTSATIYFNADAFNSATITANGSSTSPKAVTITWPALTGGTISNPTQTINYGTSPAQISASVATGGGCFNYQYSWFSSTDNITFTGLGATGQNYQPGNLTATTYFKRQTECGESDVWTTNTSTVTVYPQIIAGSITPAQTINFNTVPTLLTLAGVSGGNNVYTYQWQYSPDNIHWTTISGATSTTFTPPTLTSSTYYNVLVTSNGANANSASVLITVNPEVLPGVINPAYLNITSGSNPGEISCSPATGGACSGSFTYQWQSSPDGTTFTNISGATSKNYLPGTLSSSIWYRRQVTCGTDIEYSNACQIVIVAVSSSYNFIRERDVLKAGVMDTVTSDGLTSAYDIAQTSQYFDGLGRTVQTVVKQASPMQNDVVIPVVYDNFGRQSVQYMPYTASTNDGNYKTTAIDDQYSFNANQYPGEQYYYSEISIEASPLNRPMTSYSPGINWVGNAVGINSQYLLNTTADSVQIWSISSKQLSIPVDGGAYLSGQLYKSIVTDEQGHQIVTYKDKLGKTILLKQQLANSPGTGHVGWLNTYYVYDTLQNLRFVMQPQAVVLIDGTWTINTNIANELCFRYEYDGRRRMIIKKVPGAGQVWEVYDARNRPVMTQDSLLRTSQKWMFVKYDVENRPDSIGFITDPSNYNNLAYHDTLAYYSTNYPSVGSYTNELISQTFYDDYSWVTTLGAPVSSSMATNYVSNSNYFITNYNSSPTYAVAITAFPITHGISTGKMKKAMDVTARYLYSSNFYDDHGRLIQSQIVNYTGGIDTVTTQYNFEGALLRTLVNHKKNGNTVQSHIVLTKLDYDQVFRLRHVWKNIDGATGDQLIDSMQYNELGQLHVKYLGNSVDSLVFDYNVRGWLTGINKSYVAGTANHFFGMELGYDKSTSVAPGNSFITQEFNGNIEGTVWKSAGDGVNRKYDYTYDDANRITSAAFLQNTTGSAWDKNYLDFSVSGISYDANGNLLSMTQRGFVVGGSSAIDSLIYNYLNTNGSNKLMGVTDLANNPTSTLGDFHYNTTTKQATDYTYDGNGNLTTDNNKAIDNITYNYLNLQQTVHMNTKGTIVFTYDASGQKLKKVTTDSTSRHSITTLYMGGFVYQQTDSITNAGGGIDTLQFILHEEGRIRWAWHKYVNGSSAYKFEYDFFEKDHLGNTRMVLTQQRDTAQYLASMESAYRSTEVQLFGNITNTCYARASVSGYPPNTVYTNPNDSVSKVDFNGTSGQKTGPSLLLKVMSGDTIKMGVQSYYNSGSGTTNNSSFTDVLNSLANAIVNSAGTGHGTVSNLTANNSTVYSAVQGFLNNNETTPSGYPKAYLNWIFLDDQLNYVSSLSGVVQAASGTYPAATLNTVAPGSSLTMSKSGYLYIWVSNETQGWDVFFDNLSVQHLQGPMLEENHYYPFGLAMQGLSDKAVKPKYSENKYRYNDATEFQNKEFSDGTGLELYETSFRSFDPQLGRFGQIDPLADKANYQSTYDYAGNNPIMENDPSGLRQEKKEDPPMVLFNSIGDGLGHGGDMDNEDQGGSDGPSGYLSSYQSLAYVLNNLPSTLAGSSKYVSIDYNASPSNTLNEDTYNSNLNAVSIMNSGTYKGYEFNEDGATWVLQSAILTDNSSNFVGNNNPSIFGALATGAQIATDVNGTTWKAMSTIKGAGEVVGEIADHATIVGIGISVVSAGDHILQGNGTWRDGVTLLGAALTGIAMATGVGEIAVGIAVIGWDIYEAIEDNKK
jgi:RHS repeat-associated protein